ncbi:putative SPN1 Protein is Spt6-interacting putative elongation factor [Venustampulla echinocandica]|uniref:Putative SPN1 Protein is Spt6-interacting putative elongation factor n=1 Tax=Venustampulla echinocandica TaxID=2656787 RepID=A0A370U112_9HELO|nr:putative SPN1 Protein is Spt6-interacting putative elongation factor [Venustampulla echinocandica]RDL41462.1 putative SPN1 Protein is Spt6-interacting putative elongation factor [Venustampulla echinocandica]
MSDSDHDSRPTTPLPEAGNDAGDPNRPMSEERDTPPPPIANPDLDMDNDENMDHDSLDDLSEVDEAEFADFDPTTVALEDRPLVDIDEDIARTLKAGKRQRADKAGEGKKPKEGKRDKKKRRRDEDEDPDGERIEGKRIRKPKADGERKSRDAPREKRVATPENDENLTPEERRRRALDKAMDAALKNPNKRRRKRDEVDLEEAFDEEIANLKIRMEQACEADNQARENGQPAIHKLKMLPEVVSLLNRNTVQHSIVDPDTNFLQSVKYFLEPLSDGSLPAYNIQRDLFAALTRLPIEKEALLSSGIGKIVLFYTKSKKPEIGVKRTAEKLLGDWSRPILKRSDDYKQRKVVTREFDYHAAQLALRPGASQASQSTSSQRPGLSQRELDRQRILAQPIRSNRARMESSNTSYTVAPKSTFDPTKGLDPLARPIGAGGMEAFRKMTAKQVKKRN